LSGVSPVCRVRYFEPRDAPHAQGSASAGAAQTHPERSAEKRSGAPPKRSSLSASEGARCSSSSSSSSSSLLAGGGRPGSVTVRVGGDLLAVSSGIVVHQCNCVSKGARGVAKALFAKWPAADVYARRDHNSTPGTVDLATVRAGQAGAGLVVAGLFAQRMPGKPSRAGDDSAACRLAWFEECLETLTTALAASGAMERRVAMPFLIGCGLAGGHWPSYRACIEAWARRHGAEVVLCDKDGQSRP